MTEAGFLDRLLDLASGHERIMVVGRVDTGKSTLVKNIADHMEAWPRGLSACRHGAISIKYPVA